MEISTVPHNSLRELSAVVNSDLDYVTDLLALSGLRLGTLGMDPFRPPTRLLSTERYAAMERRFDPMGPAGVTMMCSTAALQVCVDVGEEQDAPARLAAAQALGPVLLALFANSRHQAGTDTGLASARWHSVMNTERARTYPEAPAPEPAAAWASRVMETPLMVVPRVDGPWDAPAKLTFADWIAGRGAARRLGPPTVPDLDYHLSTLFTPVRPRGYLEIRYLDAQPPESWLHPVALLTALLEKPSTLDKVLDTCAPVAESWAEAAHHGLAADDLATVARTIADLGCAAMTAVDLPDDTIADITYTVQRRAHERRGTNTSRR